MGDRCVHGVELVLHCNECGLPNNGAGPALLRQMADRTTATSDDLDELSRLHEAATPGEWRVGKGGSRVDTNWIDAGQYDEVLAPAPVECMSYCYGGSSRIELSDADAALIVAMRNTLPKLIERVKAAEEKRDWWKNTCEYWRELVGQKDRSIAIAALDLEHAEAEVKRLTEGIEGLADELGPRKVGDSRIGNYASQVAEYFTPGLDPATAAALLALLNHAAKDGE